MQGELLGQLGTGSAVPGPAAVTMGQKVPGAGVWIPRAQGLDLGGLFHIVPAPVSLWIWVFFF